MKAIFISILIIFSNLIQSECLFQTSEHIEDLKNPNNIKLIKIEIPKSKKWAKNFIKVITDRSENINPKYRDNFDAIVKVKYSFGECVYPGRVRISGDWKDHVSFIDGKMITSLDVKLYEGNIINAVRFKLLIPKTRNSFNEVLGTLILKQLGFISPETFLTKADINGTTSIFLFQENAEKEMLERNSRREGPIFEGNEELLWSYKDYDVMELADLSLSRLSNYKWSEKGNTSSLISLNSFLELQKVYLKYAYETHNADKVKANNFLGSNFKNYALVLFAMNGSHALNPHNKKYYFNSFDSKFEPIYYDGDLLLDQKINISSINNTYDINSFIESADESEINKFISIIEKLEKSNTFYDQYKYRVLYEDQIFFSKSLIQLKENLKKLILYGSNKPTSLKLESKKIDTYKTQFMLNHKKRNFENFFIAQGIKNIDDRFIFNFLKDEELIEINIDRFQLSKLISKNRLNDMRIELLPENNKIKSRNINKEIMLNGQLIYSENIELKINHTKKILDINQKEESSWVLIKDSSLKNWTINFNGTKPKQIENKKQRFNEFGLTGCLNFYNTNLKDVAINVNDGACEDSLNIVSSYGNLKLISINNAFADAFDIDFSKIEIENMTVNSAGNDCFDVSGGSYLLKLVSLSKCGDKAISVGELSYLELKKGFVNSSNISVSSKDQSIVKIDNISSENVEICAEAFNKKQEFYGGILNIKNMVCDGKVYSDSQSQVNILN